MNDEMKEVFAAIKQSKEEIADLTKLAMGKAQSAFYAGAKVIFEKYPELETVKWHQYTPYFNDGDSCEFGSYHKYADIRFKDGSWIGDYGFDESEEDRNAPEVDEERMAQEINAVREFLNNFDDDDMESMFGDHQEVFLTEDGVTTEDYEHD